MTAARFIGTNILLYSISRNPAETPKREIAIALLDADDMALSVQVLQVLCASNAHHAAGRPRPRDCGWTDPHLAALQGAGDHRARHDRRAADQADVCLSYWDAAIIAAARAVGCREVLSEDMSHGREIEGITISNPFR